MRSPRERERAAEVGQHVRQPPPMTPAGISVACTRSFASHATRAERDQGLPRSFLHDSTG